MNKKLILTLAISLLIISISPALIAEAADIHEAASSGDIEEVQDLLEEGVNPDLKDDEGRTPVMLAAKNNSNIRILEILIDAGADLEARDEAGQAIIHYGAINPETDIIEFLIDNDVNLEAKDINAADALIYAVAENPNPEVIDILLNLDVDYNLNIALLGAAEYHEDTVRFEKLIDHGADVNKVFSPNLITITHVAVSQDNPEFLKLLIEEGADLSVKNRRKETLLMHASKNSNNPEVLEILKEHGAELDARDAYDKTALIHAAESSDNPEIVNTLLDFGVNPDIKDNDGMRALDYAEENPDLEGTKAYEGLLEETEAAEN